MQQLEGLEGLVALRRQLLVQYRYQDYPYLEGYVWEVPAGRRKSGDYVVGSSRWMVRSGIS